MKPLSKERREEIIEIFESGSYWQEETSKPTDILILDLLAAEQYWREAVKSFQDGLPTDSSACCQFCHDYPPEHKPDCAWKLAQE